MKCATLVLAALALLVGGAGQARADFITDLYNTGVNSDGTLASGGDLDQHYMMDLGKGTLGSPYVSSSIPDTWLANGPNSQWIGIDPNLDQNFFKASKTGDYQTTFTIGSGYDPTTATISGSLGSSNNSIEIFLNGVDTGVEVPASTGTLTSFSLPTGTNFVSGTNTLDFEAGAIAGGKKNAFSIIALRVEMSGEVSPSAAPEPSSLVLLGIGAVGLVGFSWRRRQRAVPA